MIPHAFKRIIKDLYLEVYHTGVFNYIPDKIFIPFQYKFATGKTLDLQNPKTFNEKIQWMKLYDRNPLYPIIVDKYAVREYIKDRIGEEFLIPLLGHWKNTEQIDINKLPDSFVLKCNHDSGGIAICKSKNTFEWQSERKKIEKHLNQNHFYLSREWAYKSIKRCIIAEKYMEDIETGELRDYKFFCFNGKPKYIQVDYDRFTNHKRNIYDLKWNLVNLTIKCQNDPSRNLNRPNNLDEMIELASKLSEGFPQIRVDFYSVNGRTYFGELTIYHGSGFEEFTPEVYNELFGSFIDLNLCYKG